MRPFVHPPASSHRLRSFYLCPNHRPPGCCCLVTQSCQIFATPWTAAHQPSLCFSLPEFAQTHVSRVGDAIQPSHPLSSPSPAISLSQHQGLFQCVGSSRQVAKVLELQLQHQSFHEYSGLVAFRMDWFDLLAVQGTLKSLLAPQFESINCLKLSLLQDPTLTITGRSVPLSRRTLWAKKSKGPHWWCTVNLGMQCANACAGGVHLSSVSDTVSRRPTQRTIVIIVSYLVSVQLSSILIPVFEKKRHFILEVVLNLRESCKNKIVQKRSIYPLLRQQNANNLPFVIFVFPDLWLQMETHIWISFLILPNCSAQDLQYSVEKKWQEQTCFVFF